MVILRHESEILLLLRKKHPNIGMYVPVGGKVEPFETPSNTALREVREETGIFLSSSQLQYCGSLVETSPNNYNWVCYIYLANVHQFTPPPCDEGELHWVSIHELSTLPIPPTDETIYKYIFENRKFNFEAAYDDQLKLQWMIEMLEDEIIF
ncbi:MAG: NUDIX domain-containing protein [Saprospiraceae bacterium]|nr:NUDIX domain-containing protein [Saprospiraceae bacterium]